MRTLVKALWKQWTRVAHAIGMFQARLLLTVLYHLLLPPFVLVARLSSDPLRLRRGTAPAWHARPLPSPKLDDGREQFS